MTFKLHALRAAALVALGSALLPAHATNGYFPHGFGLKAKGMGGTAVALSHDAFAGVNNPASAAYAGNRWDIGGEIFLPKRSATLEFPAPPAGPGTVAVESGKDAFLIPEFGYNRNLSDKLAVGVTVYGNGGMNSSYPSSFPDGSNIFGGDGKLGVNLMQLIVAPTVAYKVNDNHSFGISPLLVYQQFEAYGLQAFGLDPNVGKDNSTGLGVRLGYMGKFGDSVTVGASYSPKINMSRFDKYATLFADGGDFDVPENYALGVAVKVTPSVQVAMDYSRINYSDVGSIGNSSLIQAPLGSAGGPGFGWQNVNVVKLGVQWQMNSQWTLRAGYNQGTNPIRSEDAFLNVLAPGVIKSHITLGGTYAKSANEEFTFAVWHGQKNSVTSAPMTAPVPTTISMSQNGFGLQYSRKF